MDLEKIVSGGVYQPATALNPERQFLLHHVGFDKTIVSAQGNYVVDSQSVRYLDALAQYGALPFGHNPPFLWDCLAQMRDTTQPSFVQPLLNAASEELAQRLIAMLPGMSRVTFVNSGAEATEVAIKLARARTQRRRILTVQRGFHGKTNAALCATANVKYREPFLVDEDNFVTLPFGDLAALEQALTTGEAAAFIIETVQGEGGMRVQPAGYLQAAQELCRRTGTLFVIDEVQTGLGRTGRMFGFEHHGITMPDVVLLAKALGGGLMPLGAVVCNDAAWSEAFGMLHSSTFANSHLTSAIGCATIRAIQADDQALVRNAAHCGKILRKGLDALAAKYPAAIAGVHGQGLMQGLELRAWSGAISYFNAHASYSGYAVPIVSGYLLNQHQILTAPTFNNSNVLRIQPSLLVEEHEIARVLQALEVMAALIADENFAELFSCMVPNAPSDRRPARPSALREPTTPRIQLSSDQPRKRRFAFLIHPTDDEALFNILPPSISSQGMATRERWLNWMNSWASRMNDPAPVFHMENIRSATGTDVEGWLIASQLTPTQMIRMGGDARQFLMEKYLAEASKLQVDIAGLGAFTSVISQGGATVAHCGVNLTTGNSLTALASADALLTYARLRPGHLDHERFAVIGAAGSVGRLVAFHLAHNGAAQLRLIGNAANKRALLALRAVGGEILLHALQHGTADDEYGLSRSLRTLNRSDLAMLRKQHAGNDIEYATIYDEFVRAYRDSGAAECAVSISTDVAASVSDARFVVTATSAGRSFITCDSFMPNAIVCDVARPLDVLNRMNGARDDLFVFEGGLMRLPAALRFGEQNVLGYPAGVNLACLSESIVLAMEGATRSYSVGNRIAYSEALQISAAAQRHGFMPHLDMRAAALYGPVPEDTLIPMLPELEARYHLATP